MSTIRTSSPADLDRIGRTIDAAGLDAVPAPLIDSIVALARGYQLRPIATSVLADPRAPSVARERAFGLVAMAVSTVLGRSDQEAAAA